MHDARVLYGSHEGVHVLRYVGDIRYTLAPSVERFVKELFGGTSPLAFVIDLTETDSIDSTNLGLLARIANRMRERGGPRVTIVSDQEDINEILLSMGFDQVFDIVKRNAPVVGDAQVLPEAEADRETMMRTILEAHRSLMALSERNCDQFREVVAALEKKGIGDRSPH